MAGGTLCPNGSFQGGKRGERRLDVPGSAVRIVEGQRKRGCLDQRAGNSRSVVLFSVERQALFAPWECEIRIFQHPHDSCRCKLPVSASRFITNRFLTQTPFQPIVAVAKMPSKLP